MLSNFIGESQFTKGVGFDAGSIAIVMLDVILRLRHDSKDGMSRLFLGKYVGAAIFPMWSFGLIGIFGGLTLIFGKE